jgi:ABC-2 type transport system permease protein
VDSLANLRADLAIAGRIAALRVRGQMQYRSSFLMQIIGNFIVHGVETIALWALFQHFDNLGGWSLGEVVFLHGLSMTMFAIGDTVTIGAQYVPTLIREGNFDRTLIRPMSPYIQSLVSEVSLRHFGMLIQGIGLLTIGTVVIDPGWTTLKIVALLLAVVSGAALFGALFSIEAIISFWTVNSIEAVNAFTYGGSDLGQYPLHIFRRGMRLFFLWIIPIGFVTYLPAVYVLEKPEPLGFPEWASFTSPVAALAFCVAVSRGWNLAIRHYRSTGS